jgi:hypothetical protein
MLPNYVLILNIIIGLLGIYVGVFFTVNKFKIERSITIAILIIILGAIIEITAPL